MFSTFLQIYYHSEHKSVIKFLYLISLYQTRFITKSISSLASSYGLQRQLSIKWISGYLWYVYQSHDPPRLIEWWSSVYYTSVAVAKKVLRSDIGELVDGMFFVILMYLCHWYVLKRWKKWPTVLYIFCVKLEVTINKCYWPFFDQNLYGQVKTFEWTSISIAEPYWNVLYLNTWLIL